MSDEKHICRKMIPYGFGGVGNAFCEEPATVKRGDSWYCDKHDPVRRAVQLLWKYGYTVQKEGEPICPN